MTQFIHLSDARLIAAIRRNGIKAGAVRHGELRGFYCTPVTRSVYRTHQWLRELKRWGGRSLEAVQFYLPPREQVLVGRYNAEHLSVTAAEAARIFETHDDGLGLEVIVQRRLAPNAIRRIYVPPQVVGWRFYPEAKGRKPCGCPYCNRGQMNAYRTITKP